MRRKPRLQRSVNDPELPKYSIAVASSLSGVPQQQLRRMEESGLLRPARTEGNTRRYSDENIAQISVATELADAGINAAGIRHILALMAELESLRAEVTSLRDQLASARGTAGAPPSDDRRTSAQSTAE